MKKVILAVTLFALAGIASAADVGGYWMWERGTNGGTLQAGGVSLGDKLAKLDPKLGVQATFDRSTSGKFNTDRWTATASYDLVKLGPVQTNVRAGVAYLDPQAPKASNGGAALVGVGASYPVTKQVALTADYAYQKGNNITKAYNGNIITTGVKYTF